MQKTLIAILIVVAIALSGVIVWQNLPKRTPVEVENNTPIVNNQLQANSDETAGWKTYIYKNSKIGYTLKYPSDWIAKNYDPGVMIRNSSVVKYVINSGPEPKEGSIFSVSINYMNKPQTIRELINDIPQEAEKQAKLNQIITMDIAGENREVSRLLLDVSSQSGLGVEFTVGKMIYDISYMSGSPEQFQKDMPTFQKMLDSFKLTQ